MTTRAANDLQRNILLKNTFKDQDISTTRSILKIVTLRCIENVNISVQYPYTCILNRIISAISISILFDISPHPIFGLRVDFTFLDNDGGIT